VPLEREAPVSAGATAPDVSSSLGRQPFVRRHLLGLMAGASILVALAANWWLVSRAWDAASRRVSRAAARQSNRFVGVGWDYFRNWQLKIA
jgi:hypothetical protein